MKPSLSQKNNLSLQLVTFLAAVFSFAFHTAIDKANAQSIDTELNLATDKKLIAQTWTEFQSEELSLATFDTQPEQIKDNAIAPREELVISQLNPQQQKLIAQTWTEFQSEELSLATFDNQPEIPDNAIAPRQELVISQLNPQQQKLIAQTWTEFQSEELSLATFDNQPEIPDNAIAPEQELVISQLNPQQQKLIAQTWTEFQSEELSLATFDNQPNIATNNSTSLELPSFAAQFQPQVIAQTWSELDATKLSFAAPSDSLRQIQPALENFTPPANNGKTIINPPSNREIAARIELKKVQIISPAPGVILDQSQNDSITIQYPPSAAVQLKVNGSQLDESLVTQQQLDARRNLVTQTWQGADLQSGKNTLSIVASQDGIDTETRREVMVQDTSKVTVTDKQPARDIPAKAESASKKPSPSNDSDNSPADSQPDSPSNSQPDSQPDSQPKVKILTPKNNAVLETIHSSVIIQYPQGDSAILQLNGKSVDTAQVGRTEVNPTTKLITQTWYGVVFDSGVNTLSVLTTTDGSSYKETSIEVVVPGKPEALKVETVESEVPADGKSTVTIQGGFIDQEGTISPWDETITLNSNAGKFIGTDLKPDVPGFQVKPQKGEFTATLQASYNAKNVRIQAKTSKFEAYTRTKFKTTLREQPLLTGFADLRVGARGTNFYDNFEDFLPADEDDNQVIDFTSAAFISGSFGRWSYTGAFNSDRSLNEDSEGENRLFRTFGSSEADYPTYGDDSTSEATAPSIDSVYLRLERNPQAEFAEADYFMWGDYNTEEFSTEAQEFSAISRQLHGFKSNYNLGDFQFNAFYANNAEGFQRDAIAPDGTSGFYFLSRRLIVPGSEAIYIELAPLNDPGRTVSRQRLQLGTDYEINYDRGTILFNEPVLRTDIDGQGNVLARRIVATYQFESEASDANLLAGRGRYYFERDPNNPAWLGATYLNEDRGDQDFSLWGLDGYISLGDWGNLIAEYASSENQTVFSDASGDAYRLEGEVKFSDSVQGLVHYRKSDEGFSNNATVSFIPGQTRYGGDLNAQIAKQTQLRFRYEHQDNQGFAPRPLDELEEFLDSTFEPTPGNEIDNSLSTISAGIEQEFGESELGVDLIWRDRTDNKSPEALGGSSTQLSSRFSTPIIDKLNFNALHELTLSDNTDAIFSDRIGIGLDWEFYSGLSLVLNQQWFTRGNLAGESLTSLGLQGEYEPWHNATFTGRYALANGGDGISNQGGVGLQQKIAIASGLNLDLNLEHTFSGLESGSASGQQFSQPFAVGDGASSLSFGSGTSYGIGIRYDDNPNYSIDAQWQHSDNSGGGNTVISGNVTGKLSRALTSLISYNQASSANQEFDIGTTRNLRVGLAYRDPKQDKFNALFRYEYEENGGLVPESLLISQGTSSREHLFGVEGIYAPNWRWEFYSKYAFRNSKTFIADDFASSSNVSLGQIRARYRFNYNIDLVAEGRMIWQPSADYTESGVILEAGYYLTPELRLSAGYVFGSADDEDFTGTRSTGGAYLGMTVKLNSILDGFGQHSPPAVPEGVSKKKQGDEGTRGQGEDQK